MSGIHARHVNERTPFLYKVYSNKLNFRVPTTEDDYQKNLEYFNNKEKALNSLMSKLDDLGQIMYVLWVI